MQLSRVSRSGFLLFHQCLQQSLENNNNSIRQSLTLVFLMKPMQYLERLCKHKAELLLRSKYHRLCFLSYLYFMQGILTVWLDMFLHLSSWWSRQEKYVSILTAQIPTIFPSFFVLLLLYFSSSSVLYSFYSPFPFYNCIIKYINIVSEF